MQGVCFLSSQLFWVWDGFPHSHTAAVVVFGGGISAFGTSLTLDKSHLLIVWWPGGPYLYATSFTAPAITILPHTRSGTLSFGSLEAKEASKIAPFHKLTYISPSALFPPPLPQQPSWRERGKTKKTWVSKCDVCFSCHWDAVSNCRQSR